MPHRLLGHKGTVNHVVILLDRSMVPNVDKDRTMLLGELPV
jgi:hypothetical protein